MRQAMFVLQPHGQFNFVAMRLTAGLSSSSADWAKILPGKNAVVTSPSAKSATGAARTTKRTKELIAPRSVLRVFLKRLLLNRRMFLGNSYYLSAGVSQTNLARNQAHNGPEGEHPESDPDPGNQGEHVSLNHRAPVVRRKPRE